MVDDEQQAWPRFSARPVARQEGDISSISDLEPLDARITRPLEQIFSQPSNRGLSLGQSEPPAQNSQAPTSGTHHRQASSMSYLPPTPKLANSTFSGYIVDTEDDSSLNAAYHDLIRKLQAVEIEIPGHTDKARNRPPKPMGHNPLSASRAVPNHTVSRGFLSTPVSRIVAPPPGYDELSPRIIARIDSILDEENRPSTTGYLSPEITPPQVLAGEGDPGLAHSPPTPGIQPSYVATPASFLPFSRGGKSNFQTSGDLFGHGTSAGSGGTAPFSLSQLAHNRSQSHQITAAMGVTSVMDAMPRRTTISTLGQSGGNPHGNNANPHLGHRFAGDFAPMRMLQELHGQYRNHSHNHNNHMDSTYPVGDPNLPHNTNAGTNGDRDHDLSNNNNNNNTNTHNSNLPRHHHANLLPGPTTITPPSLTSTGCSPAYRGNHFLPSNRSANIPDADNCSFFITGLPPTISTHALLAHVRDVGRIFASYINPADPSIGHLTAAAKLVFFERAAAQRFWGRHREQLPLMVGGFAAKVVRNRIKVAEPNWPRGYTRCVRISGPGEVVRREVLLGVFERNFVFHVDEILEEEEGEVETGMGEGEEGEGETMTMPEGWRTIEFRFGSWRSQAQTTFQVLRDNPLFRGVVIRYGRDPCDRVGGADADAQEEELGGEDGRQVRIGDGLVAAGMGGGEFEQMPDIETRFETRQVGDENLHFTSPAMSSDSSGPGGSTSLNTFSPDGSLAVSPSMLLRKRASCGSAGNVEDGEDILNLPLWRRVSTASPRGSQEDEAELEK